MSKVIMLYQEDEAVFFETFNEYIQNKEIHILSVNNVKKKAGRQNKMLHRLDVGEKTTEPVIKKLESYLSSKKNVTMIGLYQKANDFYTEHAKQALLNMLPEYSFTFEEIYSNADLDTFMSDISNGKQASLDITDTSVVIPMDTTIDTKKENVPKKEVVEKKQEKPKEVREKPVQKEQKKTVRENVEEKASAEKKENVVAKKDNASDTDKVKGDDTNLKKKKTDVERIMLIDTTIKELNKPISEHQSRLNYLLMEKYKTVFYYKLYQDTYRRQKKEGNVSQEQVRRELIERIYTEIPLKKILQLSALIWRIDEYKVFLESCHPFYLTEKSFLFLKEYNEWLNLFGQLLDHPMSRVTSRSLE